MRRARTAGILLLVVLAGGTLGYTLIEGWGIFDSLYMTVITVATVGFHEVHDLSRGGEGFTILLIFAGVGSIAYAIGTIAEFMVEGQLAEVLEGRRMLQRISKISDHYVVVGMGRVGSVVCAALDEQHVPFLVVDRSDECVALAAEHGWLHVQGDATTEEVLESAGVTRAKGLVTALDTDADNLFVALSARGMNPSLYIVARSSSPASESKILRSGADRVITPNVIGGRRMATSLLNPLVSDYLDIVTHNQDIEYRLEALRVGESSRIAGKSIRDAHLRDVTGAYVLAVSSGGRMESNPSPEDVLRAGDEIVAFGTRAQLDALSALL
jgi:voltage-gated potassium channel